MRLELSGVSKRFGSVVLSDVSLSLEPGHVLGLVGQNGAGKSTLVKILAGLHPDYTGSVAIDGKAAHLASPRQARAAGIAVIYQEFSLVQDMTVAENLLLGREPGSFLYSPREVATRAARILEGAGIDIGVPLSTPVTGLSPAMKQRIEIVKALFENASVLLMDEPTARLSSAEAQWLFATMRELAGRGVGVIFISHFLEEVLDVADWITVLRNGQVVASAPSADLRLDTMTTLMLGEQLRSQLADRPKHNEQAPRGPVSLEARDLSAGERLHDISLQIRSGEIVGVAGLVGSGRSRLCRVLAGADTPSSGQLLLHGNPVRLRNPQQALRAGIALIPEDRKNQGLSLVGSVGDNLTLMALREGMGPLGITPVSRVSRLAARYVEQLEVNPPDLDAPVGTLSGGNQQKVVVGKALAARPQVLIIDQPTAGVDVGTKAQLHRVLRDLADSGAALLVVSDDLDELFTLSDRMCVMRRGTIAWQGPATAMDRAKLLREISIAGPAAGPGRGRLWLARPHSRGPWFSRTARTARGSSRSWRRSRTDVRARAALRRAARARVTRTGPPGAARPARNGRRRRGFRPWCPPRGRGSPSPRRPRPRTRAGTRACGTVTATRRAAPPDSSGSGRHGRRGRSCRGWWAGRLRRSRAPARSCGSRWCRHRCCRSRSPWSHTGGWWT